MLLTKTDSHDRYSAIHGRAIARRSMIPQRSM